MYEALTGDLPFRVEKRRALLELHQREAPEPLCTRRPDLGVPGALDAAVLACLEKRPEDRPDSALSLAKLLREAVPTARGRKLAREARAAG
jgi:serine/threonine-protein kinase